MTDDDIQDLEMEAKDSRKRYLAAKAALNRCSVEYQVALETLFNRRPRKDYGDWFAKTIDELRQIDLQDEFSLPQKISDLMGQEKKTDKDKKLASKLVRVIVANKTCELD
jgi:hypothetical protein